MNRYPLWKYVFLSVTLAVGMLYALPNFFGEDPAVQVSDLRGTGFEAGLETRLVRRLEQSGLVVKGVDREDRRLLLRLEDGDAQLQAFDELRQEVGRDYVVALNLAPATPGWLTAIGALPMYLGLDLRGGVHFLIEVDMDGAVAQAEERYVGDFRTLFRDQRLRYTSISRRSDGGVSVRFRDADTLREAVRVIGREYPELAVEEVAAVDEPTLRVTLDSDAQRELRRFALQQNITTLRNRVNELGVAEPVIQQQGDSRIVVQLPGVQDPARAKDILGATATLEFRMVHQEGSIQDALAGRVPATARLYRERDGNPILLQRSVMITGEHIVDAASGIDSQTGSPAVFISLDGQGARMFSRRTADQIGRPMGVVFIENRTTSDWVDGEEVRRRETIEEVINVATIRDRLGQRFQITGLASTEEARNLALLLRAGSLAAPIDIVEERTIGPSLGQENIDQGMRSVLIGFVAVLIFMAVYYRTFGWVANLALTVNLVMILAVLSMLQATLTLPGIAGIVLTTGMAVDANVLIFERIREELRNGNTPQAAIAAGYDKALSTILDANITTLIAAVLLFAFGTGPIKGFAVTLSIGLATSMLTAIMGTRAIINLIYGGRRLTALSI